MIRVDLETDSRKFCVVYVRERTEGRGSLGERNGGATVQKSEWLPSLRVHRHRRDDPGRTQLRHLYSEGVVKAAGGE